VSLPAADVDFVDAYAKDDCGLRRDSKARAEQVRSVAAERLVHRIGVVPVQLLRELDGALRRHLAL
jgi:mRNA interferase MazF